MVNQLCIAGLVQGLPKVFTSRKKAGLDVEQVIGVISKGAAQSWQMENRYKTMAAGKFDFGFAVDWMRKDMAITLQEARKNGAKLPVAAIVRSVLRRSAIDGRPAMGYLEPDRPTGSGSLML
jgi:3-hydroxyisobutyrate dehydrogenase-like beta-hydroxyacid dehydrogenase